MLVLGNLIQSCDIKYHLESDGYSINVINPELATKTFNFSILEATGISVSTSKQFNRQVHVLSKEKRQSYEVTNN